MTTAHVRPAARAFRRSTAVAGIAMAALLAGCSTSNTPGESSPDLTGYWPDDADKKAQTSEDGTPAQGKNRGSDGLQPRYCYRSLGNVTCYNAPQPERRSQRVGSFHESNE